ncbi:nucleotidyltransferase domain-containing protein [Geomonas anaerohicana]|uniref:Nucleotidyltransferase domain-containing protein n=1 Tax=Geomonas anaerohicana TaxID=2798583 RepID=A0ABS0YK31_9BACT|nr:nucleotidyltransferase domain-containing protein [Geomonas anaerohicana]MBJ6752679.1 nucleotidyltransferase domain-containing protein [Geomonas anaerohicana]
MQVASEVLDRVLRGLGQKDRQSLLESIDMAEEAVIFGSYACGCERPDSDFDLMLVGTGRRIKTKKLDLIWVPKERLVLKSWLRTELATHIAAYGAWVKGDGTWKRRVEITKYTMNKKRLKILIALSHIYVKRADLSDISRYDLLNKVVLDILRLSYLVNKRPVPPSALIKLEFGSCDPETMLCLAKELLGDGGLVLLEQAFFCLDKSRFWRDYISPVS